MATIEELSAALVKADAAGNAADAKAFADAIRSMRASEVAPTSGEGMPKPRKEVPTSDILLSAPNKAVAGMADAILNFPANTANFVKGLVGMGAEALGKEPPFKITHPENTVEDFYKKQGVIAGYTPEDLTMPQRFLDTGIQGATGALILIFSSLLNLSSLNS